MTATHTEYGDRDIAMDGEILRTVVGSGVHGIAIPGTDDHDEMGVYIEPPERVIGMHDPADHFVYRTQPEGARSGHGDTDLVMYSLRKYLRLATKGNPTALLPLFSPAVSVITETPLGAELREMRGLFLSQHAVHRFRGYLESQRGRLLRLKPGHLPNRPELVERYGYDVKYASHALRLAYQGWEIAREGRLTLPMPDAEREHVLRVKRGEVTERDEVVADIDRIAKEIDTLLTEGRTSLPAHADTAAISVWSVDAHRRHWGWTA